MTPLLGCIADDLTGATDLALMLARHGMRTVQTIGIPDGEAPEAEALVVALKSRTIPPAQAVAQSLTALAWLKRAGARQIFFKYCSTFDSTPAGNIGPVADALLDALGGDFTIACPAFPANQRTVYLGHLFVGDVLLSASGMRNHPLTPMTESNLVAILAAQTCHKVGLVRYPVVAQGPGAIRQAFDALRRAGVRHAVVDAIEDRHLNAIGAACADLAFVTGGSGVAMGLPANFRMQGLVPEPEPIAALGTVPGYAAVIAGSCSEATLGQVAAMQTRHPAFPVTPAEIASGDVVRDALDWARPKLKDGPVLIYASAPPDQVAAAKARFGQEKASEMIEHALAAIARGLTEAGVRKLVIAGGETSGAVVSALGVRALRIGPEIDPGVPWTMSLSEPKMLLALKSGNFGRRDFFQKAFEVLA